MLKQTGCTPSFVSSCSRISRRFLCLFLVSADAKADSSPSNFTRKGFGICSVRIDLFVMLLSPVWTLWFSTRHSVLSCLDESWIDPLTPTMNLLHCTPLSYLSTFLNTLLTRGTRIPQTSAKTFVPTKFLELSLCHSGKNSVNSLYIRIVIRINTKIKCSSAKVIYCYLRATVSVVLRLAVLLRNL